MTRDVTGTCHVRVSVAVAQQRWCRPHDVTRPRRRRHRRVRIPPRGGARVGRAGGARVVGRDTGTGIRSSIHQPAAAAAACKRHRI